MEVQRSPKHGTFVLLPGDEALDESSLTASREFSVTPIAEIPGAFLAQATDLELSDAELRTRLQSLAGPAARVFNVLEDEEGHVFVPTGNLSAMLVEAPEEAQLQHWAERKSLDVISRSKWRPRSVVLRARGAQEADALEALRRLESDPEVELAQQEVLTKFKRGSTA